MCKSFLFYPNLRVKNTILEFIKNVGTLLVNPFTICLYRTIYEYLCVLEPLIINCSAFKDLDYSFKNGCTYPYFKILYRTKISLP